MTGADVSNPTGARNRAGSEIFRCLLKIFVGRLDWKTAKLDRLVTTRIVPSDTCDPGTTTIPSWNNRQEYSYHYN
jgi:hypothetical protein